MLTFHYKYIGKTYFLYTFLELSEIGVNFYEIFLEYLKIVWEHHDFLKFSFLIYQVINPRARTLLYVSLYPPSTKQYLP